MKSTPIIPVFLTGIFICLFSGCSWLEYFVVFNPTDKEAVVKYELELPQTGQFDIFNKIPELYGLKNKYIDWNKKLGAEDLDAAQYKVTVTLPPHSCLNFGRLNNDNYISYKQHFYNGRVFNLKSLIINPGEENLVVTPETFDNYFHEKNGIIKYVIAP